MDFNYRVTIIHHRVMNKSNLTTQIIKIEIIMYPKQFKVSHHIVGISTIFFVSEPQLLHRKSSLLSDSCLS